jgi:hypothetical protein
MLLSNTLTAGDHCQHHRKKKLTAFLLSLFLGPLGVDRFYLGYIGVPTTSSSRSSSMRYACRHRLTLRTVVPSAGRRQAALEPARVPAGVHCQLVLHLDEQAKVRRSDSPSLHKPLLTCARSAQARVRAHRWRCGAGVRGRGPYADRGLPVLVGRQLHLVPPHPRRDGLVARRLDPHPKGYAHSFALMRPPDDIARDDPHSSPTCTSHSRVSLHVDVLHDAHGNSLYDNM